VLTITNELQETYLSSLEECEQYQSFEYDNGGQFRTVVTRDKKGKKRKKDKANNEGNPNPNSFIAANP
jgi:hypothetical protein